MQKFDNSYGRRNVRLGKCLSGEISSRGSVLRRSVRSVKCPFREMSGGKVSVGEVSAEDLSSGKCQSGKCLLRKLSYNQIIGYLGFGDFRLKVLVTNADSFG